MAVNYKGLPCHHARGPAICQEGYCNECAIAAGLGAIGITTENTIFKKGVEKMKKTLGSRAQCNRFQVLKNQLPSLEVDQMVFRNSGYGATICLLLSNQVVKAKGISICSNEDVFNSTEGKIWSLQRALKALSRGYSSDMIALRAFSGAPLRRYQKIVAEDGRYKSACALKGGLSINDKDREAIAKSRERQLRFYSSTRRVLYGG